MSNVNIRRAVENIRASTSVYTPIVEVVVNAIQAIEGVSSNDGKITIRVERDDQRELDGSLPAVIGFEIEDNGIGFNDENRDSFDTLYTDLKINEGGKGFGRFTCLKYFENLNVDSVYKNNSEFKRRRFSMGKENDIIVNEKITKATAKASGTVVRLDTLKKGKSIDKKLSTIARSLVEKLLPYFITKDYVCPEITLMERGGSQSILLNDYFSNELSAVIKEMSAENDGFSLKASNGERAFCVRVFKFYSPKSQRSRISLVACH